MNNSKQNILVLVLATAAFSFGFFISHVGKQGEIEESLKKQESEYVAEVENLRSRIKSLNAETNSLILDTLQDIANDPKPREAAQELLEAYSKIINDPAP